MGELASLRIFVDDLSTATPFYRDIVGLELTWEGEEAAVFGDDPMIVIEHADQEAYSEGLVARFVGAAFWTQDATALASDLELRGVPLSGPPERQPWGGTLLHAKDPAGNTITFLEDMRKAA